ncbi:proline rich signal peptide protein [Mycoavidus cysteinexigens]|uniref:Proline rich signal peptide protein n=1 Tax=Mycoavidus cysteinexigens TaxID=1553431 RepID=A0A2Z6EYD8_9BURK|nr:proline rich signal peptide protein [Mycoavidus cysteinexigens]GAM53161.1 probable proline rich signal peptide protein [bacterium endosymbiont of Mortierella elongata FMR23-6]GLR01823.1 hypothetical protein GCM10007934_16350 [Mycoavidus cysteinexigens]
MIDLRLFLLKWIVAIGLIWPELALAQAHTIHVRRASLEADRLGWALDARFEFVLNESLVGAINRGIPLYFTTNFELTRARWYWFDEETVSAAQSIRLSYQPLTRQYRLSSGGLQLSFPSLADALKVIKHVNVWHTIDRAAVVPGYVYTASVRMQLDTALMPKPFQIDAVNNRDWRLSSDWKRFEFVMSQHAK